MKRDIPFSIGISVLLLLMTSCHTLTHGTWLREKMDSTVGDVSRLVGISILVLLFSLRGRVINRLEGAVMLLIYVADVIFAAIR